MSTFRTRQSESNTKKLNAILSTIIFFLILNVSIQIWLLYAALNKALEYDTHILIPAFIASLILFLISWGSLYFLPSDGRKYASSLEETTTE